ncbi:homoserine kinase [Namhaeicola litoreus]|uniref:Homoserine kinase n=1 Tax=Namhaeicola litoreus TaxID=1052145 RepID=A0ABW3Y4W0_9FLAO
MNELTIFSPATVANISCGFDVLGCCLDGIGDEMTIRKIPQKGIRISKITGMDLPLETENNVAGVAGLALLKKLKEDINFGFEIEIVKKIKPGSGIGSSAASAAGAVFAINHLLDKPFTELELIDFAREGERLACGFPITDNVAPALLGGFTLVKHDEPQKILKLPVLKDLFIVILHPQIEIKTSEARAILPIQVDLNLAVKQWANVGAFVHALHTQDELLFAASLHDYIVEPHRSKLIPGFEEIKDTALEQGALGCGISGSGPSIFSFCKGIQSAQNVKDKLEKIYRSKNIPFQIHISKINPVGIQIVESK